MVRSVKIILVDHQHLVSSGDVVLDLLVPLELEVGQGGVGGLGADHQHQVSARVGQGSESENIS